MSDSDSGYKLGSAEDELARLELQGKALAPATRRIEVAGSRSRRNSNEALTSSSGAT